MPYLLDDLEVDRVDFVDEGANSAAFIRCYKRKECNQTMEFSEIVSKLKPEHADVVNKQFEELDAQLATANDELTKAKQDNESISAELAKAKEDLATAVAELDEFKKSKPADVPFEETEVFKGMPENIREEYTKMKAQKEAAEEQVRKAAEEKVEQEAVAKAQTLKSLPVEQDTLVAILKGCDTAVFDVLSAAAAAIDNTVLTEVGKAANGAATVAATSNDAWNKIEALANDIATRDGVTKQKAVATAISENPSLYREYLNGGAN